MSPAAAGAIAFVAGYAVGCLPVAWLLVRRDLGVDLRRRGVGGTSALNTLAVAGVRTTATALALEVAKGAAVALAALAITRSGWMVTAAIAGCVAGDAFPPGFRHRGRGVVPLASALVVALPVAALVTALAAFIAWSLAPPRLRRWEVVLAIAAPIGLVAGIREWRTIPPALAISAVLVARARLRRQTRALRPRDPWRSLVVDADPVNPPPPPPPGRQNARPWDSSSPTG